MGRGGARNGEIEEGTRADPGTMKRGGMGGCKYRREGCSGDALTKMGRGGARNAGTEGERTRADPGTVKKEAWEDASTGKKGVVKWAEVKLEMLEYRDREQGQIQVRERGGGHGRMQVPERREQWRCAYKMGQRRS